MTRALLIIALACAGIVPAYAGPSFDLSDARHAVALAVAEARRLNAPGGTIAVVDAGGHLVALERLDNSFPASASVSIDKARTAAVFRKPTRDFENAIKNGRTSLVAVDVMLPLQGGVPLMRDGQVVGAIGVSGAATAQQDDDIASAAAAGFEKSWPGNASTDSVSYLDAKDVAAAFAKGAPLLETATYKVHASRREKAGMAEVHDRDTDVIYVLDGAATLITGGTVVDARVTGADETRGTYIDRGEARRLSKGDVVVVPNGVPHWFKEVQAPFLYYVVKVTDSSPSVGGTR